MDLAIVVSRLKAKIADKEALLARYDEERFASGYMNLDSSITELKAIISDLEKCMPVIGQKTSIPESHPANGMRDRPSINNGMAD